ncbi:MAG: Ig-like domain-containing protein [Bacteroidota bacterium]
MRRIVFQIFVLLFIGLVVINCATRGNVEGGPRDLDAPLILRQTPDNYSTNFNSKEIRIYFDEYVKVKDLQKQLIISPPMDTEPTVTPLGNASKYIQIIINDTLDENTTYAFNFGRSIVDNNEENPYDYYRYVFSTGNYIDSLRVTGRILDAENRQPDDFVSVMLYEVDSTYNDSTVYNKKPKYITNTLDSLTVFSIDNIKPGTYKLIALKEENPNYTFQPKSDKIGFHEGFITVPTDSFYKITMFKEELDFKATRSKQVAGQKIAFAYEGNPKGTEIEALGDSLKDLTTRIIKDEKADTLYYWYKPKVELDSALFVVKNKNYLDTLTHKFRQIDKDSLVVKATSGNTLNFTEDFRLTGNTPLEKYDKSQITILDKDSLEIDFTTSFVEINNEFKVTFDKEESQTYGITVLPNAIEDFFGNVNDTLNFKVRTKTLADYSNIRVTLRNATYPLIAQLVTDRAEVKYEQPVSEERQVDFKNLIPGSYYLRIIIDANANEKWDTGNILKGLQPERIVYYPDLIEARANWDPVITFTLK